VAIEQFSDEISTIIKYDPDKGPWDNTLLISKGYVENNLLLGVPAGTGLSFLIDPEQLTQVKSHYLIIDESDYALLSQMTCLEFKLRTDLGALYVNHGMNCTR
jgi:hypothetical protein